MAADGGPAVGRGAAATGLATAAATGAAAGASAASGSPSRAATSEAVKAGRLFRPRRACSAAMVDLLHFFPSATHLATSALMGPLGAGADGVAACAAGAAGAEAAGAALSSTGSPSRADISALFSADKPLRPRRACSAAIVDLLHFRPSATHLATSGLMPPAAAEGAAAGGAAAGGGAGAELAAAGVGVLAAGAAPSSHGMGCPALRASISASVSSGNPLR